MRYCLLTAVIAFTLSSCHTVGRQSFHSANPKHNSSHVDAGFITKPLPHTVALTFDDGPSPYYTVRILKILSQYNVHATFFVTGQYVRKNPALLKAILNQGSAIANHTYHHSNLTTVTVDKMQHEVMKANRLIYRITGLHPRCFRPPYLAINNQVTEFITRHHFAIIMGQSSDDYIQMGADKLAKRVIDMIKPGSIIILHDGYLRREQTVAALPTIIEGIEEKGLGFSTLCKQPQQETRPNQLAYHHRN